MDLFFKLLLTVFKAFRGPRDANVWDGSVFRFKPGAGDRMRSGQLLSSRIPSFIDLSLINFFIATRMSAVVRRHGWIPVVLSSVQTRQQAMIPQGRLQIHTRVVGWHDQYVEIRHTWTDESGTDVLESLYLTRVTHSGRNKVTGADMLQALGMPVTEKPLSAAARGLLDEYLRVKDANVLTREADSGLSLA